MGNLFASTGLGDEKPHERDVEYSGFAGRRPCEIQNENPETPAVHTSTSVHYYRLGMGMGNSCKCQKLESLVYIFVTDD